MSKQRVTLTGSVDNKGIKIAATATAGTPVHAVPAGSSEQEEISLWAWNTHTGDVVVSIEYAGVGADNTIKHTVANNVGLVKLVDGLLLDAGQSVAVFAATTNVVYVYGFSEQQETWRVR